MIFYFFTGLFVPKNQVLGNEFAGVIEEVGSHVSNFKVGDKIFGFNDIPAGPEVIKQNPQPSKLDKDRYISYEDNVKFPLVKLSKRLSLLLTN